MPHGVTHPQTPGESGTYPGRIVKEPPTGPALPGPWPRGLLALFGLTGVPAVVSRRSELFQLEPIGWKPTCPYTYSGVAPLQMTQVGTWICVPGDGFRLVDQFSPSVETSNLVVVSEPRAMDATPAHATRVLTRVFVFHFARPRKPTAAPAPANPCVSDPIDTGLKHLNSRHAHKINWFSSCKRGTASNARRERGSPMRDSHGRRRSRLRECPCRPNVHDFRFSRGVSRVEVPTASPPGCRVSHDHRGSVSAEAGSSSVKNEKPLFGFPKRGKSVCICE